MSYVKVHIPSSYLFITAASFQERGRSIIFDVPTKDGNGRQVLLPKSQIEIWTAGDGLAVYLPVWLFEDRKLENAVRPNGGLGDEVFRYGRWLETAKEIEAK